MQGWDDELELMSLRNALNCEIKDDVCRKTAKFKNVGQRFANLGSTPNHREIKEAIQKSMQVWNNHIEEVEKLDWSRLGRWAQLFQSNAHRIGCSVVQYTDRQGRKRTLIGCNYRSLFLVFKYMKL